MTKCLSLRTAAAAITAALLSAASGAAELPMRQASARMVVLATPGVSTRAVGFTGWSSSFISGRDLARTHASAQCDQPEREWSELLQRRVGIELRQAFNDELGRANYSSPSNALRPALEVSAFLNDFDMRVCHVGTGRWRGGFYVQLTWKVQESNSGRVLYEASTDGSYTSAGVQTASAAAGLREAISVAVRNLLSERRFVSVLQPQAASASLLALE